MRKNDQKEGKTLRFCLRWSEEERAAIEKAAKRTNRPISNFILTAALEECKLIHLQFKKTKP